MTQFPCWQLLQPLLMVSYHKLQGQLCLEAEDRPAQQTAVARSWRGPSFSWALQWESLLGRADVLLPGLWEARRGLCAPAPV